MNEKQLPCSRLEEIRRWRGAIDSVSAQSLEQIKSTCEPVVLETAFGDWRDLTMDRQCRRIHRLASALGDMVSRRLDRPGG